MPAASCPRTAPPVLGAKSACDGCGACAAGGAAPFAATHRGRKSVASGLAIISRSMTTAIRWTVRGGGWTIGRMNAVCSRFAPPFLVNGIPLVGCCPRWSPATPAHRQRGDAPDLHQDSRCAAQSRLSFCHIRVNGRPVALNRFAVALSPTFPPSSAQLDVPTIRSTRLDTLRCICLESARPVAQEPAMTPLRQRMLDDMQIRIWRRRRSAPTWSTSPASPATSVGRRRDWVPRTFARTWCLDH
jgi:hypothetical protein